MITPFINNLLPKFNNRLGFTNNYISNPNNKYNINYQYGLSKDTVNINFKANFDEDTYNLIKDNAIKDNFIGRGTEGFVFNIKNTDNVLKIPKKFFDGKNLKYDEIKKNLKQSYDITEQDKVNFIEKKYDNGIIIMKKIKGKPIESLEEYNEVADLPLKVYKNLINQIMDAHSKGMLFDYATNNLLYDKENKTLTAIDFRYEKEDDKKFKPLENLYFAFDCFKKPYENKIAGNILSGALKTLKTNNEKEYNVMYYDFDNIINLLKYNNHDEKLLAISELSEYLDAIKLRKITDEGKFDKQITDNYIVNANVFIRDNLRT
jgi:hypothetical protein